MEETFDSIYDLHTNHGHQKDEITYTAVQSQYANITRDLVSLFIDGCKSCNSLRPRKPPHVGAIQPIRSERFRDRWQVDLVCMMTRDGSGATDIFGHKCAIWL